MTNNQKVLLIALALVLIAIGITAQQQVPGGGSVTITSGNVTAAQGTAASLSGYWPVRVTDGTNTMPTGDSAARTIHTTMDNSSVAVTGTFWQNTQPVSMTSLPGLAAGTALIGQTYPYTSCGTTKFTKALQAMPTASTAIATSTTCILQMQIANPSAGALTVTVSDNQGTPVNFLNAVSLNPGETRTYLALGSFTSGIKMQASGSGITYSLEGLQ